MSKDKIKKNILIILKISIAVFVIWYLFRSGRLTKETLTKFFNVDNINFIMFSALAFLVCQLLSTVRLLSLLTAINFPLRFSHVFKLTMIGNFFNIVIPGSVGGDIVKGYYLIKNEKNNKGRSSGILVTDRALGLLAIMLFGGVSIVYLLYQKNAGLSPYHMEIYISFTVIGIIFSVFLSLIVFGRNQFIREILKFFFTMILRKSIFYHMVDGFGVLVKKWLILVRCFLISLSIQFISLMGLFVLAKMTANVLPGFITIMAISSFVVLVGSIPVTPGNIGWMELVASFVWSAVGSNEGAAIFFYWRMIAIFCSIPGGVLYLFIYHKNEKNSDAAITIKS